MARFTARTVVPAAVEEVFAWHERPGALERLSPPWEGTRVEQAPQGLAVGTRVVLRAQLAGPMFRRWVAEHVGYDPPHEFRDVQVSGPFAAWDHQHRFAVHGEGTELTDDVTYRLPLGCVGDAFAARLVRERLQRMFDYRHRQTAADLAAHRRAAARGTRTLHVAVTGASGLIGSALTAFLTTGGHRVTRLVRRRAHSADEASWDPAAGTIDVERLRGLDAVINLAGATSFRHFTKAHKRRFRESRVRGTALLAETLATMEDGPRVLVNGSAVGYYGRDRGSERLTEASSSGDGFLADVVREWEAATAPAEAAGLRVVKVRTGLVQTPKGGILQLQLIPFRLLLGGRLGSGRQWMSWVTIDDIVGIFHHALTTDVEGVLNGGAPEPVTNAEFTRVLGKVLCRPTLVPVPRFGPELLFGQDGAAETAFASQRMIPERTVATGYEFRHPDLETGLRHVLGR